MKRIPALFVAALIAAAMLLAAVGPAAAMPPSPRLLAIARRDPALARRLTRLQKVMRARGIDAPRKVRIRSRTASGSLTTIYRSAAPSPGVHRALVLLVDFSDASATVPPAFFDDLLFKNGSETESVRGFYKKMSYGKVDLETSDAPTVVGWIRLPRTLRYYSGVDVGGAWGVGDPNNPSITDYPNNAQRMVEDAVQAAGSRVDFSKYASGAGQEVGPLFVIHAGRGAEFTGVTTDIWSHEWQTSHDVAVDGVYVSNYSTEPEYWLSPGDMTIGVYCHELGHVFGLPDLYDTTPGGLLDNYASQGLGNWSLMAGGSWNGPLGLGESPSRPDAWSEINLGFATATTVTASANATIGPVDSASTGRIFRVGPDGASSGPEYFLAENRRLTGTDAYLPAQGLLVYHVDDSMADNSNRFHYRVGLEEAHGGTQQLRIAMSSGGNAGDSLDPFGTSANRTFDDFSDPSALVWNATGSEDVQSNSAVVDIGAAVDATMSAHFAVVKPTDDLVPGIKSNPSRAIAGEVATVTWGVYDDGLTTAAASSARFYLSADPLFDSSDVTLTSMAIPELGPLGHFTATTAVTIPIDEPPGPKYILLQANADGSIPEADTGNDIVHSPMRVVARAPDLMIGVGAHPPVSAPDSTSDIGWTVTNGGDLPSSPTTVVVIYSPSGTPGPGDMTIGQTPVAGLGTGASLQGVTSVHIPASVPEGTASFRIVVDPGDELPDLDPLNNAAAFSLSVVLPRPDLSAAVAGAPSSSWPGSRVSVSWAVTNHGAASAASTVLDVASSGNGVWGSPGNTVLAVVPVPALAAGASASGVASLVLPAGLLVGTNYVMVAVNPTHAISEPDYSDNTAARAITILAPRSTRFSTPSLKRVGTRTFTVTSRLYGAPSRSHVAIQVFNGVWRTRAYGYTSGGYLRLRVKFPYSDRGRRKVRLTYGGSPGYRSSNSAGVMVTIR